MSTDVIYGPHAVQAMLETSPDRLDQVFLQRGPGSQKQKALAVLAERAGIKVTYKDKSSLDALAKTTKHQGVLGICFHRTDIVNQDDVLSLIESQERPAFLLILDGVQDPHNLGACLRTAAAAHVDAVIAPKDRSVGLTPVVKKVASGGAEMCPFVQVTNLSRFMEQLQSLGVWIYGADASPDATLYSADFTGPVAWVLGAEGAGLRENTRKHCDHIVSIPMPGGMESLNVSVAAGVCLFETVRQRLVPTRRS